MTGMNTIVEKIISGSSFFLKILFFQELPVCNHIDNLTNFICHTETPDVKQCRSGIRNFGYFFISSANREGGIELICKKSAGTAVPALYHNLYLII